MKCLPIDDALEKYYTQISNITLKLQKPENNYIEQNKLYYKLLAIRQIHFLKFS